MAAILRRRGFSLVEMTVAVGLLAGCLLLLLTAFPTASRAVRQAEGVQTAAFLASRQIERARSLSYAAMADETSSAEMSVVRNGTPVKLRFDVELRVTEAAAGLKLLRSTVRWSDSQPRSLTLETYAPQI